MFPSPSAYQQPFNSTLLSLVTPTALHPPIYYNTRPSLLSSVSDKHLSLIAPFAIYWIYSLVYHALDSAKLPYFEARRLHESPEVLSRNKATVFQVIKAVVVQQIIQTILGLIWLEDDATIAKRELYRDHLGEMGQLAPCVADATLLVFGRKSGEDMLRNHGEAMVRWVYWWGIPAAQMLFAFFLMDTWQYFMHRLFHTSRFLYRHIHSVHHRLYVPYAFGALYNHPLEGFVFDTLGALIVQEASRMSIRQTVFFFAFSTMKTVDDHSGYKLWWDPCQFIFPNNADYHDIHHQVYGMKSNFSQPYFTNWDKLLGTHMSREQAPKKTRRPVKVD